MVIRSSGTTARSGESSRTLISWTRWRWSAPSVSVMSCTRSPPRATLTTCVPRQIASSGMQSSIATRARDRSKASWVFVHVVLRLVRRLTGPVRGEVSPAGQQNAVGHPDPVAHQLVEVVVLDAVRDLRVQHQRFPASAVHRLDQLGRADLGAVAQCRGARGEPGRDDHERVSGSGRSSRHHHQPQWVLLRSGLRMPRNSQSPPFAVERTSSLSVGWAPTSLRIGVGPSTMWLRRVPRPSTSTSTTSPG